MPRVPCIGLPWASISPSAGEGRGGGTPYPLNQRWLSFGHLHQLAPLQLRTHLVPPRSKILTGAAIYQVFSQYTGSEEEGRKGESKRQKVRGKEMESLRVLYFLTLEYLLTLFSWK